MLDPLRQQAKRPVSAVLAGPYGHPFHPILVTIPIGAWIAALVFDAAAQIVGEPAFLAQGAMWLIAIGILGALAAALTGFMDLFAIPPGTRAHRVALVHMSANLIVTCAYGLNFWWRSAPAGDPREVSAGMLALSALSLALLGFSGFLGGKLAFHYGVRVADEATQAEGFGTTAAPAPGSTASPQSTPSPRSTASPRSTRSN